MSALVTIGRVPVSESTLNLLLTTYPLLRLLRGERRDHFRRAWMAAALSHASTLMHCEEGSLPTHPKAVIAALARAVIQLGEAHGFSSGDFIEAFNGLKDAGRVDAADGDELMARCIALLSVLGARRMEAA